MSAPTSEHRSTIAGCTDKGRHVGTRPRAQCDGDAHDALPPLTGVSIWLDDLSRERIVTRELTAQGPVTAR